MTHLDKTLIDINRRNINMRQYAVEDTLSKFIVEKYPKFVSFIKAYYEFEDEDDSPSRLIDELFITRDITQTDIKLLAYIEDELLLGQSYFEGFTDKRAAAKYSNTLYRSKGSKYSIQQFFRTFFGIDPEIIYTKEQVFKIQNADGEGSRIGAESQKFLTDDKLYQEFAILIKNELPVTQWRAPYKLFVHPAGMYLGGQVQIVSVVDLDIDFQPGPGVPDVPDFEVEGIATLNNTLTGGTEPYAINQMTALFRYTDSDGLRVGVTPETDGQFFRTDVGSGYPRGNELEDFGDTSFEEIDKIYSSIAEYLTPDSPTLDDDDDTVTDDAGVATPINGLDLSTNFETLDKDRFTWYDPNDEEDNIEEFISGDAGNTV